MGLRLAIVGATGLVGGEFLKILEQRNFPIDSLQLFASDASILRSVRPNLIKNELVFDEMVDCFVDDLLILER